VLALSVPIAFVPAFVSLLDWSRLVELLLRLFGRRTAGSG